jgi:glucokinase
VATLVFDIGGTSTRAGFVAGGETVIQRRVRAATPNHLGAPDSPFEELKDCLLALMTRLGGEVAGTEAVDAVVVAFAGPVSPAGDVLAAPTIWGTRMGAPYRMGEDLARIWPQARVHVLNDVSAAGYRYLRSNEDDLCIVTVSSGIGSKVFCQGRPLVGPHGVGGELGHLRVDPSDDAPLCECGGRGHLGAVSSGRGILDAACRYAAEGGKSAALTSSDLVAAFHRREPWALEAIERGAAPLGWALAAMHLGLGIERFILIGGFALACGEAYRLLVAQAARTRCWSGAGDWDDWVELGVNDDASGMVGAAIAVARLEEER